MDLDFARLLRQHVWGQGFPEPRFCGAFEVAAQRVVGEKHSKLALLCNGHRFSAMLFGKPEPLPARINAVYRVDLNEYQGTTTLQLTIDHVS